MYPFYKGVLIALLLVCPIPLRGQIPAGSQAPDPLDLSRILEDLETGNLDLEAARLYAQALEKRPAQVSAYPDPTMRVLIQPWPVHTARGVQRSQWQLEQPLPVPGKRILRRRIAELHTQDAELNVRALRLALMNEAKESYYELYRIQETDSMIGSFQALLRSFEEAATAHYEVGAGTQAAILKAQLERQRLDLKREQLAAERQAAQQNLARLLGHTDASAFRGTVTTSLPTSLPDSLQLLAYALQHDPKALASVRNVQRAEQQVALARLAFWPDVMVSVTYFDIAASKVPPSSDGRDALGVGFGVRIPLERASLHARLQETRLGRQRLDTSRRALEVETHAHIQTLISQYDRLQRQIRQFEETLIPQAEAALEAALSAYTNTGGDFFDMLDAERTLFSLRLDHTDTVVAILNTVAELEKTIGVRWLNEIEL
ncbi:MAG: TolC family protein [Bacteroidetes bacterium]|nr:TolC family protein [Bacteroidota bacterium]